MDAWSEEHGYLSPDGNSPGFVREYFAAINTARLTLKALAAHLKDRQPSDELADYVRERYGNNQ